MADAAIVVEGADGGSPGLAPPTAVVAVPSQTGAATVVIVRGLKRTELSAVLELLPRAPPAVYSDVELVETERRLANLGIFDHVAVMRTAQGVEIDVREKWTLIPSVDMARGKTFKDTYLLLGATEYNFLGRGTELRGIVYHAERAWNGEIAFAQHGYHPTRASWFGMLEWSNASYRFEDSDDAWYMRRIGGEFGRARPLLHGRFFNYELVGDYHYEIVDDIGGLHRPPGGSSVLVGVNLIWNRHRWSDLDPRGWMFMLYGGGGGLFNRHVVEDRLLLDAYFFYGLPLARHTLLAARIKAQVSSVGNVNFSGLLGGLEGVRGLDDSLYRNWAQGFVNLELRQAIPLHKRLALQFVAFSDGAVFQQLNAEGRRADAGTALSAGGGVRLIPTFLAQVLLRVDVARLMIPYRELFIQWGLSQYF